MVRQNKKEYDMKTIQTKVGNFEIPYGQMRRVKKTTKVVLLNDGRAKFHIRGGDVYANPTDRASTSEIHSIKYFNHKGIEL